MDLFDEIKESVADGSITHGDDVQELVTEFSNNLSEEEQDGFDDLAWKELAEFKNLGYDDDDE
jgi:hypothetical protein